MADILFGDVNPSGKLPITFYRNDAQLPDYEDYSMKGRTYRYFSDPLFAFGYGLSYTTFEIGEATSRVDGDAVTVTIPVKNAGNCKGTETVQLYIRNLQDPDGPLKSLRGFQRVTLNPGETKNIDIKLDKKSFEFWDAETNTMRSKSGSYELLYGNSSQDKDLKKMTVKL